MVHGTVLVSGNEPVSMVTKCYLCELQVSPLGSETADSVAHLTQRGSEGGAGGKGEGEW